jgi:hypothetical protein
MKKVLFACMLSVFFFLILLIPANAQDNGQKKIHVVVEENGTVITDTSVFFDKTVSEEEIQAVISDISGEKSRPCQARNQQAMHCDTVVYKCKHIQNSELDSLLEVSGKSFTHTCTHTDTCRHAEGSHGPCMNHTEKVGAGQEPCKHIEKEIRIIETRDDEKDMPEGCTKMTVEKKVIVTNEGGRTEKIIILESPDEAGNKGSEKKVTITEEGDKAEKTIILESPAETEKKTKKEN